MKHRKDFRSAWGKAGNKFGAQHYHSDLLSSAPSLSGVPDKFMSIGEGVYGEFLYARLLNSEIEDLQFQVKVELSIQGVRIGQRCMFVDFRYRELRNPGGLIDGAFEQGGDPCDRIVYDDFKGSMTAEWALKLDLWKAGAGPSVMRVTKRNKSRAIPYSHDHHWPAGMERR